LQWKNLRDAPKIYSLRSMKENLGQQEKLEKGAARPCGVRDPVLVPVYFVSEAVVGDGIETMCFRQVAEPVYAQVQL